jgi:molybdate transport system substrate-binding protein
MIWRDSLCAALVAGILALPVSAQDVTVFAAASLGGVLQDIATAWRADTGGTLTIVAAGSSAIARQIQQGAPADVVILASTDWMDALEVSGDILPGTRVDLLSNSLVLIGGAAAGPVDLADLPGELAGGRLAMALVDAVPAGIYGRAALDYLGHWQVLQPQVVQADNVRAALAFVATGAVPMGIVYATDAQADPRVAILARFPGDSHPPILYPAAAVTHGDIAAATDFLTFLNAPAAQAAFAEAGFTPLRPVP